ncbi:cell division protein FtsZ [Aureimonas sp. ME7]|uniref:cell division protein FtsZ n=1 Tax=Aureimonas sp. ME7 TaxID=2744252 RepID=UPI0015F652AA|nr:cell division protein FtsZ [Aureimonas sp. ME7]
MSITLQKPDITELKPRITVFGVGGGGCNAVNNMINAGLEGVEFVIANTDAQALRSSRAERVIQMGVAVTEGLGAGSQPEVGRAAAEESLDEICDHLLGSHMCFVTAGMGGGTGTGAAPVVARAAREKGILTVGVVTKPFHFEGQRRLRIAEQGIEELQKNVDTLIVIPNQNLFRIANDKTTFADAFGMADQVLYSGVACITDLMVKEGLINLDFADVRSVMREMGKAMMGTGEASGEGRAMAAAEAAIANPLLDETSMKGAKGLLISITGGRDLTLFEVDEAATRIREEVDQDANIILGATFDENLEGVIRVSVVATGIDKAAMEVYGHSEARATAPAVAARPAPAPQPAPVAHVPAPAPVMQQPMPAPVAAQPAYHAQPVQAQALPDIEDDFTAALEAEIAQVAPRAPAPRQPVQSQPVQTRMPRVEDFPPVVQAEIERRNAALEASGDDRGPMGLLRRLTTGLSRREEDEAILADPVRPAPAQRRPAEQSAYAPRRQAADSAARPQTATRPASEDDQLEIPAFLRRQSN